MKPKQCKNKNCCNKFTPERQFQTTCGWECSIEYAKQLKEKKAKDATKQNNIAKRAFKASDRSIIKEKAQRLVNKYARLRDQYENGYRCCTCGIAKGKMDGGHFLPTSTYSAVRYNTNQIHQQCVNCNRYNAGRRAEYKIFMIEKYGEEYVQKLEALQGVTRSYSTEYLLKLIRVVNKKIKIIEKKIEQI